MTAAFAIRVLLATPAVAEEYDEGLNGRPVFAVPGIDALLLS